MNSSQMNLATRSRTVADIAQMLADCELPSDFQPPVGRPEKNTGDILLTGATGFLGAHLLLTLLRKTDAVIYCLVRGSSREKAEKRFRNVLRNYELDISGSEHRAHLVVGNVCAPQLGIDDASFDFLATKIDAIYHCAASVNWSLSYNEIHDINVVAVLELLRLACIGKNKHFHFVSSIGVCFSTTGPKVVSEESNMASYLDGIYLGYAQSKVVAESLIRNAAKLGMHTTIHRSELISGDSTKGISNENDFVSRMIKGCIQMECAPDLNWSLDCCPVDNIAESIYCLSISDLENSGTFHLSHQNPRHWRDLVLWMNINGYPVVLISYEEWLEKFNLTARNPRHALYAMRSFFLSIPLGYGGLSFPEIYENHNRSTVTSIRTNAILNNHSLEPTPLDTSLLEKYFNHYTNSGFLHDVQPISQISKSHQFTDSHEDVATNILHTIVSVESRQSTHLVHMDIDSEGSIISELTSWRSGNSNGIFRYQVEDNLVPESEKNTFMVKVKAYDKDVQYVGAAVARMCSETLGATFSEFVSQTGIEGCHKKELAIYAQRDPSFMRFLPEVYGIIENDAQKRWILVMEDLTGCTYLDTKAARDRWPGGYIEAVTKGLAKLHSVWFRREVELLTQPWLYYRSSSVEVEYARPLWEALTEHSSTFLNGEEREGIRKLQSELIENIGDWWGQFESMDRTLIHNDFNPRNIGLRNTTDDLMLCAFDWELATLGVPQRDLAEFLCFTLGGDFGRNEVLSYIELHRKELSKATGIYLNPDLWMQGFRLSLCELIVSRIPLYVMINTVRRQVFLQRVVDTWRKLFSEFPLEHYRLQI